METMCREAYALPTNPPDFVEFGEEVEDWEEVLGRAITFEFVQREAMGREPWVAVYRVVFKDGPKFYLVAG